MVIDTNLQVAIIANASTLFMENGYAGTSIKQIAEAAGCTTAALYYYFEEGKGHILREVIKNQFEDVAEFVNEIEAENVQSFVYKLGGVFSQSASDMLKRSYWLVPELGNLTEDQRQFIRQQDIQLHQAIAARLVKYFADHEKAQTIAWILMSAFIGYGHYRFVMGIPAVGESFEDYRDVLISAVVGLIDE